MKTKNIVILAGAALALFLFVNRKESATAETSKVYASHQYPPVWQGLPVVERKYTYA